MPVDFRLTFAITAYPLYFVSDQRLSTKTGLLAIVSKFLSSNCLYRKVIDDYHVMY